MKFVLAILVSLFVLTGCTGGLSVPTGDKTESTAQATGPSKRDLYIRLLREEAPQLDSVPDRMLFKNARVVCSLFDQGQTFTDVFLLYDSEGFPPKVAGTLIGAAVAFKCPEYKTRLTDGL